MSCAWLTIQEAADFIKVHPATIKVYIKSGKLKASKPSTHIVRICLDDISTFMEGKE